MIRDHGGNVGEIARRYGIDEDTILDFSANINPLGYSPALKEAIIKNFDSILNYPDMDSVDLVAGLSRYHDIEEDHIMVGNGSTEFMYSIPLAFKPKKALIVTPAFSEYEKGLRIAGADVTYFQTDETRKFSIDISFLCSRLGEGFDILYLCNPANPTGILTPREQLLTLIARAQEIGVLSVIDEAFIDFVEEESVKRAILEFSNLIVLRSMTKFFGVPGLRIGYVMAALPRIATIKDKRIPWSVNALVQKAAVKALWDSHYIMKTRDYVCHERDVLRHALHEISGLQAFEGAANFLFVSIDRSAGLTSTELRNRLEPEGILIRDCSNFVGLDDRYFRVAVKSHDQNMVLIEKLKGIIQ
ncbi:MAG: threonine-phosphate decarboxylase [Deltaproteobacteria bacterium]|nr:threonine-phosphate decarboxylase [Deltaproteobacteria bacterium]